MKEEKSEEKKELLKKYDQSFRRWLVYEIESGRMTIGTAVEQFDFASVDPVRSIRGWLKRYSSPVLVTLPVMTAEEKQQAEVVANRLKALEKQLEQAQMKNLALETMIDVAEEQFKIQIRKKSGPKQ